LEPVGLSHASQSRRCRCPLIQCVLNSFEDAPVFITAEPFYDGEGMDKDNLVSWYRRFGFESWRHKLNLDGKWMVREPQKENGPAEK